MSQELHHELIGEAMLGIANALTEILSCEIDPRFLGTLAAVIGRGDSANVYLFPKGQQITGESRPLAEVTYSGHHTPPILQVYNQGKINLEWTAELNKVIYQTTQGKIGELSVEFTLHTLSNAIPTQSGNASKLERYYILEGNECPPHIAQYLKRRIQEDRPILLRPGDIQVIAMRTLRVRSIVGKPGTYDIV